MMQDGRCTRALGGPVFGALLALAILLPASAAAQNAPANPHGLETGAPPQDRSSADPTIPAGQVQVSVIGAKREPIAGVKVTLHAHFQSVAQGNNEKQSSLKTDERGVATFKNVDATLRYTYSVQVERDGAVYSIPGFRLDKVGQNVVVHTYPVTSDPKVAFVGLQGFVTVRVREDLWRVDALYRVHNMSRNTYRPRPISIRLPKDAQGVEAEISDGNTGFRATDGGVELVGTFPPGQKDVPFAFHVPNKNEETQTFTMSLPPHVVDMNVLAEKSPNMGLSVSPGFEPAQERVGRDQKKVLLTRRVLAPGDAGMESIEVEVSGLPVVGPGRWWAVLVALAIAVLGLAGAFLRKKGDSEEKRADEDRARRALLAELRLLQKALDEGLIGPRTFEQTRRELMHALARLEPNV